MYEDIYESRKFTKAETISELIRLVDGMLNTPTKRHIVGGTLLSVSLLFGGLAITAMTIKEDY